MRYQLLGGLLLLTVIAYNLTPPSGLSAAGYHALVLFGVTIVLWVSGLLPIAVTALLSMVMLPLAGILPAKQTYALFGNEAVFFILGAFILAAAMTGTGLSARLARTMLARFGRTPRRLALTVYLLAAGLSFCMSEHAVAAMLFPGGGRDHRQSRAESRAKAATPAAVHVDRLGLYHRRDRHLSGRGQSPAGGAAAAGEQRAGILVSGLDPGRRDDRRAAAGRSAT